MVAIPRCSHRSIARFMVSGVWAEIKTEQGELIQNPRVANA
jgi:hypothetical protein